MRCDDCQDRLLDLEYGLLDPAEVAALEAHVATCPSCSAAIATARDQKALLARAARQSFPNVQFIPPGDKVVTRRRSVPRAEMVRWAVAAGVLLALAGTVGPTIHSAIRGAAERNSTSAAVAAVRNTRQNWTAEKTALADRTTVVRNALESANRSHDAVVTEWVKAETEALNAKSFAVEVTGPASAVAGAPNDYRIRVADPLGQPVSAAVEVAVTDTAGKVRAEAKYEPSMAKNGASFRLPASAWNDLPAGSGLTLAISATDATGRKSQLAEPINLLPPVYTTLLATDRPLYQPGETILFRSVTLDRTRFLPPDHDLPLRFVLLDPKGVEVPGMILSGASTPATLDGTNQPVPVVGPDGRPVRGIGCGAFRLPGQLNAGEYTLAVFELPTGWTKAERPAGSVPLAKRKVQIRKYYPSRANLVFAASGYGPGDTVVATVTANDQGRPLANVQILPAVTVDGKRVTPVQAPFTLDADGKATISFTLPNDPEISRAEIRIMILHGQSEEVVGQVPLSLKTVDVEFFPEGGDLIAGVEGRVYFRARTPDSMPAEFRGELFDGEKNVSPVSTESDPKQPGTNRGLGVFSFKPEAGKKYRLRGRVGEFPLPAVKPDGIVLTIPTGVIGATQPIPIQLTVGKTKKNVIVGAYSRGRPVATARATVEPGKASSVELRPEPDSPGGVTRVTVFEESDDESPGRKVLTPVAERLIFRRPAEALVLSYTTQAGATAPDMPANLNVTAKTEKGQPTAAVLWAAVVSETVFGRADDRTARGMPAHFFICGEVEKPDDLEYADFLLTNHPKAAESLDLLLGTQGWRRFAEQAPEVFHRNAKPDEADRLMVAVGSRGPVPAEFRPLVQRAAEKYRPRYEKALATVEAAEREAKIDSGSTDAAYQQYVNALASLEQVKTSSRTLEDEWHPLRVPTAVALLLSAGLLALVRYRVFRPGDAERRYLMAAILTAVALAGFLITIVAVESRDGRWDAAEELRYAEANGVTIPRVGPNAMVRPGVFAKSQNQPNGERVTIQDSMAAAPGVIVRSDPVTPTPSGSGSPLESAANGGRAVRVIVDKDPRISGLTQDYAHQVGFRLTAAAPPGPAADRVRAAAPKLPPFVVREYSHPSQVSPNRAGGSFDATDTVLWKPVLVVPGTGTVDLSFNLSGDTSGYRVLIAGHTLDGRVGSVTGKVTMEPSK